LHAARRRWRREIRAFFAARLRTRVGNCGRRFAIPRFAISRFTIPRSPRTGGFPTEGAGAGAKLGGLGGIDLHAAAELMEQAEVRARDRAPGVARFDIQLGGALVSTGDVGFISTLEASKRINAERPAAVEILEYP
jgi:hypothetical protein